MGRVKGVMPGQSNEETQGSYMCIGVARGTASLVRNTLLGSFDAISKLSGALGTGVAYLSFDDRFVADRRTDFRDRRPRHIGTGLMLGKHMQWHEVANSLMTVCL